MPAPPPVKEAAKPAEKASGDGVPAEKPVQGATVQTPDVPPTADPDGESAAGDQGAEAAAVAKPVTDEPIQVYGWREYVILDGVKERLQAKLDTGALTSSIHAEEMELFERDGKKWVRFIITDPRVKKPSRTRLEAPLVRIARVKEPGGDSVAREVVRLGFSIGERKVRGEFTLNNRSNMLAPVLIGRTMLKDLGWVDSGRTDLSDQKIFR
ncbi:MAG: RimK/LysX family protein [Akkermansiaceae bacterium]